MKRLGLRPSLVVGLFLLHCLPFATRPALIGGDEPHYALMAHSIAVDGDFQLADDYAEVAAGSTAAGRKRAGQALDRHLIEVNGRQVFSHPLGLPLITAPLVWILRHLAGDAPPDLVLGLFGLSLSFVALLAGWRLLWRWTDNARVAALAAFGVYFTSPLWFYSRSFFTEPYTWSFAVLSLAAFSGGRVTLAAIFLALTLAMKETALLLVAAILAGVALHAGIRVAGRLALGPLVFGVLFLAKNAVLVGKPLTTFQPYRYGSIVEGSLGLLVDPARGLLWFAPLLCVPVAWLGLHAPRRAPSWLAAATFATYFLVTACWIDWRGGSGYGPRLLVPALAALAVPLAALIATACARHRSVLLMLQLLFVAGFTVQWCAALDPVAAFWSIPVGELVAAKPVATGAGAGVGSGLLALLWHGISPRPFRRASPLDT